MLNARITSNLPLVRKKFNKFFRKYPKLLKIGLELAGLQLREIILTKKIIETKETKKHKIGRAHV